MLNCELRMANCEMSNPSSEIRNPQSLTRLKPGDPGAYSMELAYGKPC
jgi:hypothetical protein